MKNWDNEDFDNIAKRERVRKREKAKKTDRESLEKFILTPEEFEKKKKDPAYFSARVVEVHKRYAFISVEKKEQKIDTNDVWLASVARRYLTALRQERNFLVCGDQVLCVQDENALDELVEDDDLPHCLIEYRKERHGSVVREDPMTRDRMHVLATNVDQLIIVASFLSPEVKWGLIDRYLVMAESQGLKASIILNKEDLLKENDKEKFKQRCEHYIEIYKALGYSILTLQANIEPLPKTMRKTLAGIFKGKITLLSGHSGVGKSSIVNSLKPEIEQDVEKEVIFKKGRHTTTYASLIKLGTGGYIIDTPGIRSFSLPPLTPLELAYGFIEIPPLSSSCRYRECRHKEEPDCGVKQGVEQGIMSKARYESYLTLLEETLTAKSMRLY